MSGPRANERGFTLLETMIAGGMLVAGVMGLMGMQITAINGGRFGNRSSQALMFAEEMANTMQSQTWATLSAYPTAPDASQPDGFIELPIDSDDPSSASLAIPADGLTAEGAVVAYNAGLYQRCVQLIGEEMNANSAGDDAVRVKVTVRFRDSERTTRWRESSIIVLRAKLL